MKHSINNHLRAFIATAALTAGVAAARTDEVPFAQTNIQSPFVLNVEPEQHCGVMLGGVGTGYLELQPDGQIHDWGIFNRGRWGYRGDFWDANKLDRLPLAEMDASALQFYVWAKPQGQPSTTRRLSTDGELMNPYSAINWVQNVAGIKYNSSFPGAQLQYVDDTMPVQVSAKYFSPFIPHELKIAGTPGMYAIFTITNPAKVPQDVSLVSYLRNPLARGGGGPNRGAAARKLHNEVKTEDATTYLTQRTDAGEPFHTALGTVCLSMTGGKASWIASDFGEYLVGRTIGIQQWNQRFESPWRDFRDTGTLPDSSDEPCPTTLGAIKVGGQKLPDTRDLPKLLAANRKAEIDKLSDGQIKAIIDQAKKIPSLKSIVDQATAVDPALLEPSKRGRELVDVIRQAVGQYAGEDGKAVNWGDSMLCSSVKLAPGESKQITVVFSWNFPNHPSPYDDKKNLGHMYSVWFKDAAEVNHYLVANAADFAKRVDAFRTVLTDSTLPGELLASVSAQLNTMVCSSWWTADGNMGMWEGLGTIGQNTVDVSYQGSHPICSLFPEWEKSWTKLATKYQNSETGRLYHSLPNDFDKGSDKNGYGYVDVNCHFAMEMTRDYLWFGDKAYLDFYYPHLVKEIGVFEALDTDGDGLPDQHTNSNTYDTWDLQGTPSYMCSIYIGALRCGIRMAQDAGDSENARKWRVEMDKAVASMNAKLWNGQYYSLWVDGKDRDECCMADQLSGEMYTKLIGLGDSLPSDHVRSALDSVYKYNFTPDQGLWNGAYPPGTQPHMPAYRNVQGEGNWTGIEYATAASMISQGMVDQGMAVIKSVYQRYIRVGRIYNHEECGPHYYRPLSIWAALLATTGEKVDAPHGVLTLEPPIKQETLKAPLVTATGIGTFVKSSAGFDIACSDGQITFLELRLNGESGTPLAKRIYSVSLNGKPMPVTSAISGDELVLSFANPVVLKTGDQVNTR